MEYVGIWIDVLGWFLVSAWIDTVVWCGVDPHKECRPSHVVQTLICGVDPNNMWWHTLQTAVICWSSSLPRLLVGVVNWSATLLVRHICLQIILTESSEGSLLICRSLAIRLPVVSPSPSGRERSGVYCYMLTLMVALIHLVCFLFVPFLRHYCPPS